MGSGVGGAYSRTWGSAADRELRERVAGLVKGAAGAVAGDSAARLAEALLRVAAGESAEGIEFPEPGDVAFDLALDALSAFVPGGAAATRSLGLAARAGAKAGKGAAKGTEAAEKTASVKKGEVKYYILAYPWTPAKLPKGEAQLKHIFREKHGLADTPESRKKLTEFVRDGEHFKGMDKERKHFWYSRVGDDGFQLWAEVRDGVVKNAGINPKERPWNDITGFRSNPHADGSWRGGKKAKGGSK